MVATLVVVVTQWLHSVGSSGYTVEVVMVVVEVGEATAEVHCMQNNLKVR